MDDSHNHGGSQKADYGGLSIQIITFPCAKKRMYCFLKDRQITLKLQELTGNILQLTADDKTRISSAIRFRRPHDNKIAINSFWQK